MRSAGERVDELSALVQTLRAKLDAGLSDAAKRTIIDLLDVTVLIDIADEQKYVEATCQLTLDRARLRIADGPSSSVDSTLRRSGRRWSAKP